MSETKRIARQRAESFAVREPQLTTSLGLIVLMGMEEIAFMEIIAGDRLLHTYSTHFPMPDGQTWDLKLSKREVSDAR